MTRPTSPPMAPLEIVDYLRDKFREPAIDHLVARTEREQGKRARIEAGEARTELRRWREGSG